MIRKLQWKMVAIIAGILLLVFGVVFATLNLFMQRSSVQQTTQVLELIARQDGLEEAERFDAGEPDGGISPWEQPPGSDPNDSQLPEEGLGPEILRSSRIFYVKLNTGGTLLEVQIDRMFDFTEQDAENYALTAYGRTSDSGTIDGYQYLVQEKDYGYIAVFAERGIETQMLSQLMEVSLWVAGVTFAVLILVSIFLSRWAVRPVKTAFDKQRQFVSDASHELKTPLTILSANADVLEHEIGANTRLEQIKAQAGRMQSLIHDLLHLARADEGIQADVFASFPLSQAVLSSTLEFESRAFEEHKQLRYEITENLLMLGSESQIRQLVSILLDNAIAHSPAGGEILLTLRREGQKLVLQVYNTGDGVAAEELEKLFDRFYRSDSSRSRETGGFGLGLSIAKSIVEQHKGKLTAQSKQGAWITFTAVFPQ